MIERKLKILFIASLGDVSASGWQRLWAMEQCGVEVRVINKHDYKASFIINKFTHFFKLSRLLIANKLETSIEETTKEFKPDIIWFEWPKEVSSVLLTNLKKNMPRLTLVSFVDDNPWGKRINELWMWANYMQTIPNFDKHIVKRQTDIDNLTQLGAKSCYLWAHGIYTPLFKPSIPDYPLKYPVSFVGTCFDGREKLLGYLLENNIDIHVFGANWHKKSDLPKRFPNNFHPYVSGQAYVDVLWASKICLGLVSHSNEDEWTMRTYEVPGCGKLLLAEDTGVHKKIFNDLSEKILFSSYVDCLIKIKYFLLNDDLTKQLGLQTHVHFLNSGYCLNNCMQQFLDTIKLQQN